MLPKFAWRNLSRKFKRTIYLLIGLALANTLIIWILTFRQKSHETMINHITGLKMGREELASPGYVNFDKKKLYPHKHFSWKKVKPLVPVHIPFSFRVEAIMMLAGSTNAIPVKLSGYDLEAEQKFSGMKERFQQIDFSSDWPLILGKRLADRLGVKKGDQVAVIGQSLDGSVANENFTLIDTWDLGGGAFEDVYAISSMSAIQRLLILPVDEAHLLINYSTESLGQLAHEQNLESLSWKQFLPEIASGSRFMDNFTKFYAFFFAVIASLAMGNTLALSFLERLPEYRALTIIGAPKKWLRKSMLLETFFLGFLSMLLGNILILIIITIFHYFPLDLSIMTGGEPFRSGGMIIDQKIVLAPIGWIFLLSNTLFAVTLGLASLYPIRTVLNRSEGVPS